MNEISALIKNDAFAKAVMDSIPCGVIVIDKRGCVCAYNDIIQRVFGVSEHAVLGKGFGHALCCLHTFKMAGNCKLETCCNFCEIRDLAFSVLSQKQKRKARTSVQLIIDGQVRNVILLLSAVPFTFNNSMYCSLIIEDVT